MQVYRGFFAFYILFLNLQGILLRSVKRPRKERHVLLREDLLRLRQLHQMRFPDAELAPLPDMESLPSSSLPSYDINNDLAKSEGAHIPKIVCANRRSVPCPIAYGPHQNIEFHCIRDTQLCNGVLDCPDGSDEDEVGCMFHGWATKHFHQLEEEISDLSR